MPVQSTSAGSPAGTPSLYWLPMTTSDTTVGPTARMVRLAVLLAGMFACTSTQAQNLLDDPGFESGTAGWTGFGPASVARTQDSPWEGNWALRVSGRTDSWNGATVSLLGLLEPGRAYRFSARVRLAGASDETLTLQLARTDGRGETYPRILTSVGTAGEWVELSEIYTHSEEGTATRLDWYIAGPPAGVGYDIDAVSVEALPTDWKATANARIAELRQRELVVTVFDADGEPLPGATVRMEQVKRAFPVGMVIDINAFRAHAPYRQYIAQRFDWAVHENAAKWYANEPSQGNVSYQAADEVLAWADARGITMRGHTIFWAPEQWQPDWVRSLDGQPLRTAVENRLNSAATHFRGRFAHWDVNNEMLHGRFFADRLGDDIRDWMFHRSRELDPDVALFLNDYNVLSQGETDLYARQLQGFLDRGVPVDGVGLQGHFTGAVDPWAVQERLDKMGRFGLPLWITELDVTEPDPQQRADGLEAVLRMAYSHPDVEGVMLWGFWAGNHWRGPNAALVNQDWSLNPAGQRLDALLAEWTSDETVTTNSDGAASARLYHGDYELTITTPDGILGRTLAVAAGAGAQFLDVTLADPYAGEATLIRTIEAGADPDSSFTSSSGVAERDNGDLLIADEDAGRVLSCDRSGHCVDLASGGETPSWCAPTGVAAGPGGDVWVIDQCGVPVSWCGDGSACAPVDDFGLLEGPYAVTATTPGRALVGDYETGRILDCDASDGCTDLELGFSRVLDLAVDAQDRLFVVHFKQPRGTDLSLCVDGNCAVFLPESEPPRDGVAAVAVDHHNRLLMLTAPDPLVEIMTPNSLYACDHAARCEKIYESSASNPDAFGRLAITAENHVLTGRYPGSRIDLLDIPDPEPLNPGFNDAWYNPATAGQGFFVNVFPQGGTVFLAWFTFDTERPANGNAVIGEAGHRWLTAAGTILDNRAELTVYRSSGGVFDQASPAPQTVPAGRISLQFHGCGEGTVSYTLDDVNESLVVTPIRRVVSDNVALCEALARMPDD